MCLEVLDVQSRRLKNKSKVLETPLKQKFKFMKSVQLKAGKNLNLLFKAKQIKAFQ